MIERSAVASLLRSSQAYAQQICERETGRFGIAFFSERFGLLPEACQLREVVIEREQDIPEAYRECESLFAAHGLTCLRWAPAGGTASDAITAFLSKQRFEPREMCVMMLSRWPEPVQAPELRILPVRAMRRAFGDALRQAAARQHPGRLDQYVEAFEERLDDPHLDMSIAMLDGRPVATAGLYEVGDIARVIGLHHLPGLEPQRILPGLIFHVLNLARRLSMRMIVAQIDARDPDCRRLFEELGFVEQGRIIEFERITSDANQPQ